MAAEAAAAGTLAKSSQASCSVYAPWSIRRSSSSPPVTSSRHMNILYLVSYTLRVRRREGGRRVSQRRGCSAAAARS